MKRLLLAATLAAAAIILVPGQSRAVGIHPDCAHGFPWWQAKCLNKFAWIHMNGPLYNYGPYNCSVPGYVWRPYPPAAYHHQYIPAYPAAYMGMGGYSGQAPVHNGAQAAPQAHPAHSAAPAQQQSAPQQFAAPAAVAPFQPIQPSVGYYPTYLGQVWPGGQ